MPALRKQLLETRSLPSLGEYFCSDNREALFSLVLESKLSPLEANTALDSLSELCSAENDLQINLISNILKQKAINYSRIGDIP